MLVPAIVVKDRNVADHCQRAKIINNDVVLKTRHWKQPLNSMVMTNTALPHIHGMGTGEDITDSVCLRI